MTTWCDLSGLKFGKLTIISYSKYVYDPLNPKAETNDIYWVCECECGRKFDVPTKHLHRDASCGECKEIFAQFRNVKNEGSI